MGTPIAIVEAKRTSRYPLAGKEQASEYAEAIQRETGREPFIFMTNGPEIWFWDRSWSAPRPTQGVLTLDDLETLRFQNENQQPLVSITIDPTIVDRLYQLSGRWSDGLHVIHDEIFLRCRLACNGETPTRQTIEAVLQREVQVDKKFQTSKPGAYLEGQYAAWLLREGVDSLLKEIRLYPG